MNNITAISQITASDVAEYLRIDDITTSETNYLNTLITVSKEYILQYTGIEETELDTYKDLIIVVFVLCQDMYDNRAMYVDNSNVNKVVETILGMHQVNLL